MAITLPEVLQQPSLIGGLGLVEGECDDFSPGWSAASAKVQNGAGSPNVSNSVHIGVSES